MKLTDRLALAEHWLAQQLPRVPLRVQLQCVTAGHAYADNGPALRELRPGAQATIGWCARCHRRRPVRRNEASLRTVFWSTGWEGR